MKNLSLMCLVVLLTGCANFLPVERKFPPVPEELTAGCPALKEVPKGTKELSTMLGVVTENYGTYYDCHDKVEIWQEWYNQQKKIFEEVD